MNTITKILTTASAAIVLGGTVLAAASPASAASRNGVCESGEFCYYFNSGNKGSVSDFAGSVGDYGTKQPSCFDFKGPGAGKGKCVKNAAASVWNRSGKTVRVYFNSNYGGSVTQDFKPGAKGNLKPALKNQNASHQFGPSSSARVNMSYALYKTGGGHVSCAFDGYTNTRGRHEGIDIARRIGSDVHALVGGQLIYLARGRNGGSGLSTIAIYNASLNKTIIYLHSAPLSSLRVGQQISRGQIIADEAWHGVSSSSAAHTHVEMRPGRQKLAAKSVGDPTLSNPNPNAFWASQGYNVR
ncbi:murein DD-endopeptidase MepM/ murein hydrolase activator NlpD [Sphaerisporangium siamense]|uniref:Murein DD-endopeptidase MepM/ murein hydrolase activator NlpD n=2 Tax=Sphaerisporangium siamense TaxID=795645 RepID=A0A7W7D717_9ACTN|nr:peptidase inhibitor family I36 protein [Sphaerisporangium siamense]MBB4700146.1 murein DD-endopeptidase MepM/ murein hydrolase activator NlpD [Sphaerisporangium siamense]